MSKGSKLAQYHAPFPFKAFVLTATRASYLLLMTLAVASAASADCVVPGEFAAAIDESSALLQLTTVTLNPILIKITPFTVPFASGI